LKEGRKSVKKEKRTDGNYNKSLTADKRRVE
jgi:hypothetical protein